MKEFLVMLIAGASILPLIINAKILRRSVTYHGDVAGAFGIVVLVLGGLLYEARVVPTGQAAQLSVLGLLIMSVVLVVATSIKSARGSRFHVAGELFLPAAISVIMFLTNALMNIELPLEQSFGRLLAVAILALIGVLASISRVSLEDVCRIIVISVLTIFVISVLIPNVWRACDIFKCGPFGAIYTGPFASENALAIFACVGILCTLSTWTGPSSAFTLIPLALTLYATESRTSQLALAGALGIWCFSLLWKRASTRNFKGRVSPFRLQGLILTMIISCLFITSFYLLLTAEPSSFSNRGNVWIRGLGALGEDWWSGLGLDRWSYLQSVGVLPLLFPHSQYLLLLFGGGLLSIVFLFFFFTSAIRRSAVEGSRLPFAASYAVFLSILGWTEAYWNPITFDGHTFLILPLMFIIAARWSNATKADVSDQPATASSLSLTRASAEYR